MNLPVNSTLQGGKYKIVRFISAGGFGCTYEGLHVMLKRRVAIKEFFVKDFCNRDETTSQVTIGITAKIALVSKLKTKFIEEAQSLCSLDHPNIVHVYDVFEDNGTAYYVMDYIDGPSLNDMIKKAGPMSEQKAVRYILQIADALKYVHSQNRLHLDIKPGNIMVDKKDNAMLIDFGASKQYDEEGGENTSTLLGKTPGYAPLEQMGNDVVKFLPSTDIYALGATLYKLLTGVTPPSASLLASGEKLKPLSSFISENVCNAVYKSMRTNKLERPQNINEFISILIHPTEEDESTIVTDEKTIIDEDDKTIIQDTTNKSQSDVKQSNKSKVQVDDNVAGISKYKKMIGVSVVGAILAIIGFALIPSSTNRQLSNNPIDGQSSDMTETRRIHERQAQNETFTAKDGKRFSYTGPVINDLPNGQGVGVYELGTYKGNYVNGIREGENCEFRTKDGHNTYKGSFKNDMYDKGNLYSSGYTFKGTFSDGQPYNGTWYDSQNKEYAKVVNGNNE